MFAFTHTYFNVSGIQISTTYWPAWMTDVEKLVVFKLQFVDAGENALKKFDHILPVSVDFCSGKNSYES